jgi:O-antigen/teichoic acid export membrane protein
MSVTRAAGLSVSTDATLFVTALVSMPVLVTRLGVDSYGVLLFASVIATQLGVLQFGVGPALIRKIVETRAGKSVGEAAAVTWGGIVLGLVTGLVAAGVATILLNASRSAAAEASAQLLTRDTRAVVAFVALISLQPLLAAFQSLLLGAERYGAQSLFRLCQGLGRTIAMVATVVAGGGVADALWAQVVSDGLAIAAVCLACVSRKAIPSVVVALRSAYGLLAAGFPFALTGLLLVVLADAERLVLGFAGTARDLSFYAVPYALLSRLNSVASALATAIWPRLAMADADGRRTEAQPLVERSTRVLVTVVAVPALLFIAVAPELISAWLGPEFSEQATLPARIAAVAMVVGAGAYPVGAAMGASRRATALVPLYVAQLPLLLFAYLAIELGGVVGASMSLLVRSAVNAALHGVFARRVLGYRRFVGREILRVVGVVLPFAVLSDLNFAHLLLRVAVGSVAVVGLLRWRLTVDDWLAISRAVGWSSAASRPE